MPYRPSIIRIGTGRGAAWRGIYLHSFGRQLGRVTLDPEPYRPTLSFAIPIGFYRAAAGRVCVRLFERRLRIPHISWARASGGGIWLALYSIQARVLSGLDGRSGWFTPARRRRKAAAKASNRRM